MKEIEADKVKKFGYRIGQLLAITFCGCIAALAIGGTVAILRFLF